MKKILIVRFSSIGDVVLTTPVIRCLRKKYPEAEIHFCTKKQYVQLVEHNPNLDKVISMESSLHALISELKAEKYDVVIDLHRNLRTLRIKIALGLKHYTFKKLNFRKFLITKFKVNILPDIHIVHRYMNAVKSLGVVYDGEGLDFFIPDTQTNLPVELNYTEGQYVVYAIGAQHATKKLPPAKAIEMLKAVNLPVVLIGGKEDDKMALEIIAGLAEKTILNGCGKWTLMQSAIVCKESKVVISHDTGMMHISAAFNKPIVSVWGNTIPAFGMHPFYKDGEQYKNLKMYEVANLQCRPCSKIGFDKCPQGHFNCMNLQDFSSIGKFI